MFIINYSNCMFHVNTYASVTKVSIIKDYLMMMMMMMMMTTTTTTMMMMMRTSINWWFKYKIKSAHAIEYIFFGKSHYIKRGIAAASLKILRERHSGASRMHHCIIVKIRGKPKN